MVEATAVTAEGRITHGDVGLWHDGQTAPLKRIAGFLKDNGAVPAIQLAHAGRKASMQRPWFGNAALDEADRARGDLPWRTVAPSAIPMDEGWLTPHALDVAELARLARAVAARHAARGRAPVSTSSKSTAPMATCCMNSCRRCPTAATMAMAAIAPGGCAIRSRSSRPCAPHGRPTSRCRFASPRSTASKAGWSSPTRSPLRVEAKARGVDLIDCSSGGLMGSATAARIPRGYGFQVPFADAIRKQADIATIAVGLILHPQQAEDILAQRPRRSDRDRARGAVRSELAAARRTRAWRARAARCSAPGRSNMAGGWSAASRACASSTVRPCRSAGCETPRLRRDVERRLHVGMEAAVIVDRAGFLQHRSHGLLRRHRRHRSRRFARSRCGRRCPC